MHGNSLNIMKWFVESYLPDEALKILDIGSRVVPGQESLGSYRQYFTNAKWQYIGADMAPGENVDILIQEDYKFPFSDGEFDVVISGQTIEHVEYPWMWFVEMARVLKQGGICFIIAPAVIHLHRYPIDTYRYYPDGMKALAKWSGLKTLGTKKTLNDTFLFAKKV